MMMPGSVATIAARQSKKAGAMARAGFHFYPEKLSSAWRELR
jgi:hypothetical protein